MPPAYSNVLPNPSRRKKLLIAAILVLWLVTLLRAISVLAPGTIHVIYNSDGAIPILMANEKRPITIFDHYYYAAGRWGGWPMIAARLIHQTTGYRWTPKSFHAYRAVWLFIGILVFALLNPRNALFLVLIGLSLICLDSNLTMRLFDPGQVYAWQITACFWPVQFEAAVRRRSGKSGWKETSFEASFVGCPAVLVFPSVNLEFVCQWALLVFPGSPGNGVVTSE